MIKKRYSTFPCDDDSHRLTLMSINANAISGASDDIRRILFFSSVRALFTIYGKRITLRMAVRKRRQNMQLFSQLRRGFFQGSLI